MNEIQKRDSLEIIEGHPASPATAAAVRIDRNDLDIKFFRINVLLLRNGRCCAAGQGALCIPAGYYIILAKVRSVHGSL